jgi:hypothetical protein
MMRNPRARGLITPSALTPARAPRLKRAIRPGQLPRRPAAEATIAAGSMVIGRELHERFMVLGTHAGGVTTTRAACRGGGPDGAEDGERNRRRRLVVPVRRASRTCRRRDLRQLEVPARRSCLPPRLIRRRARGGMQDGHGRRVKTATRAPRSVAAPTPRWRTSYVAGRNSGRPRRISARPLEAVVAVARRSPAATQRTFH